MSEEAQGTPSKTSAVETSQNLRGNVENVKKQLQVFIDYLKNPNREKTEKEDIGEQIANAILAFRHLEDAKMRLGKIIQATEGQSVYDK